MTFGASQLLKEHGGSRLRVAEAFILGEVDLYEDFVPELVDKITLEAARIRLDAMGMLNKANITR